MTNEEIGVLLDNLSKRISKIEDFLEKRKFDRFSDPQMEADEMYDQAVALVRQHETMSVSVLQRRLGIGFNRAANLIEALEENGLVGPPNGAKPRKVLAK